MTLEGAAEPELVAPSRPDWRRGAVRNAAANGLSRVVSLGLGFLLTPVILHAIGAEAFGLWVLVGSIVAYGSLLNLGIGGALTKYIAQHRARNEVAAARATIRAALRLYVLMGLLVAAVGVALAPLLPRLIAVPLELELVAQLTAALMAVGLGTGIACSTAPAVLRGLQRYDVAGAIAIVTSLLAAGATLLALALGWGLVGIVALGVPMPLVSQLLAAAAVRRIAPELSPAVGLVPVPSIGLLGAPSAGAAAPDESFVAGETAGESATAVPTGLTRRILGYSWPLLLLDVAGMLQSKTDEIVVGVMLSLGAVTPYSLARRLSAIPRTLAEQFAILLLPLASELDALDDRERLRRLYLGGVRLSLAIAMPLTGCLALLAVPVLTAWVGPGFEGSAPIVVILVVATAVDLSMWPAGFVLQGIDRHHWLAPISLGSGVANLALSLALVRPFGIVGVAVGTLIPTTIEAVVLLTPFTLRTLGIGPLRFLGESLAPALLPLIPMLAVVAGASIVVPPTSAIAIVALVALAHAVYALVYLATGPAAPERRLALELARGLPVLRRGTR
jgi:O-antigen/teichoic acid export membrane protein